MNWTTHVTVASVVERDGRFLIVEENAGGSIVLNQPAGHLDPGESLAQAAIRETREETGWCFTPVHVVGVYRWPHPDGTTTFLRTCFTGTVTEYEPSPTLDEEILRVLWLTREELIARAAQHRSPQVLRCIDDYLDGRRFPLDLLVDV